MVLCVSHGPDNAHRFSVCLVGGLLSHSIGPVVKGEHVVPMVCVLMGGVEHASDIYSLVGMCM